MGAVISDYLVNFAKTGNPNGSALPQWPRYDPQADVLMDFALDGKARALRDPLTVGK
jgi:para-nitrobenzyl esterase